MSEKSTRWTFTAYKDQFDMFVTKPELVVQWKWNHEMCPTTQREHYQGWMRMSRQVRFAQVQKMFPGVHLEIPRNWAAVLNYCQKSATRIEGGNHNHDDLPKQTLKMADALIKVAQHRDPEAKCPHDDLADIAKWKGNQYDIAVSSILTEDPDLVGLYAQPIFRNSWIKWSSVFIEKADVLP